MRLIAQLLAYLCLSGVSFYSIAVTNTKTFLGWGDAVSQTYPWLMKLWHTLRAGELPLWDFGIFSGTTFVGELQTAPFYPLSWLFAPFATSYNPHLVDLFLLLHFSLAAFFMHEFLRALDFKLPACIVGAILFAYLSPVTLRVLAQPNLFCGLVFMPAAALCTVKAINSKRLPNTILLSAFGGLALALSILAGHVHSAIHIFICVVLVTAAALVWEKSITLSKAFCVIAIEGLVGVLGSSLQLIATREYLQSAYKFYDGGFTRAPHIVPFSEMTKHALQPELLKSAFDSNPLNYGGPSLFVGFSGLVLILISLKKWKSTPSKLAWLIIISSAVLGCSGTGIIGPVLYHIPVLNLVREPDRALHLYAFGAALAAAVGMSVLNEINLRVLKLEQCLMSIFLLVFCLEAFCFDQKLGVRTVSKSAPTYQFLKNPILDILVKATKSDGSLFRVGTLRPDLVNENAGDVLAIFGASGYRATILGEYYDYRARVSGLESPQLDLMSIRYVVGDEAKPNLVELGHANGLFVYRRPSPLPIFWNLDRNGVQRREAIGKAAWKCNSVRLDLDRPIDGWVIFSQPYYPGWLATVDGKSRELSKFDLFTRMSICPQDKCIELKYAPAWLLPFGLLSILVFAAPLVGACYLAAFARFGTQPLAVEKHPS